MILDILHLEIEAGRMDFTGAAAPPNSVALSQIPFGASMILAAAHGRQWFEAGDNVKLNTAWFNIPFGFGQGQEPIAGPTSGGGRVCLMWLGADAVLYPMPELGIGVSGGEGTLAIPEYNCPIPLLDLYVRVPTAVIQSYTMVMVGPVSLYVSMVGIPAALIGQAVNPIFYLEVLHTKQMKSVP